MVEACYLDFPVSVLPLIHRRNLFNDIPVLHHHVVLDSVEVVKDRRLVVEKPFIHDKDKITFSHNPVNFGHFIDKSWFGERARSYLSSGFVVFAKAIVLMKLASEPRRLVTMSGAAGAAVYVASKHAVEGLTRAAALEVAESGVRVNVVAPGPIDTGMLARFTGTDENKAALIERVPVKRVGRPEEVAQTIVFITGASIAVDGGKLAR